MLTYDIMSEQLGQSNVSLIEEPLLFFGNDVYFGYPPRYYVELEKARARAVQEIENANEAGKPFSEEESHNYIDSLTYRVQSDWYQQAFRGRRTPRELSSQYPGVETWIWD